MFLKMSFEIAGMHDLVHL